MKQWNSKIQKFKNINRKTTIKKPKQNYPQKFNIFYDFKRRKYKTEINKQSCLHIYKLNKLVSKARQSTQNNNSNETQTQSKKQKNQTISEISVPNYIFILKNSKT